MFLDLAQDLLLLVGKLGKQLLKAEALSLHDSHCYSKLKGPYSQHFIFFLTYESA
jgi:hypothetical protein